MKSNTPRNLIIISLLLLSTSLFSSVPSAHAQSSTFESIDAFIQEQMKDMLIPGIAYGLVMDNETVYTNAFGKADNDGASMTSETPMHLGAMGKTFISTLMMKLTETNNITLNQTVQSIFPWFTTSNSLESSKITLEQCLYHFTGIPTSLDISILLNNSLEEIVRKFDTIQLSSTPGSEFIYSNYNYIILGAIIEKVSNMTLNDSFHIFIADPLEMNNVYTSIDEAKANGLSHGYQPWFGLQQISNKEYSKSNIVTEQFIASADDMTHFIVAHLNSGNYENTTILNKTNIQMIHSIPEKFQDKSYYAMGWANHTLDEYEVISHLGNLDDTFADMMLIPSEGIGAVILINTNNFLGQTAYYQELVPSILKMLLDQEPTVRNMTYIFLYMIIDLLIILSIVFEGRRYIKFEDRLKNFLADFKDPKERRSQAIGKSIADFMIVPFILLGVPGIVSLMMGIPGFNLRMLMSLQQDLGLWIFFFGASALIQAILRVAYFKKKKIY
ncbi:Putative D-alanyl-D-alanine carboxypeptidase [Candidatus Lokiarchaeum ossiferum]|uniref:D-alanyl-D-alanine carboxypeptidase n=1 Tax=Candidatus Lokiarchaeum ossiferum TaxID=2951803 RepID=A0ABY6HPR9_9ARCH|nr:Putative D-alanyl-D-alanine carboxypeptidase [Candidatus Lokiarchaeum sp. B-35]